MVRLNIHIKNYEYLNKTRAYFYSATLNILRFTDNDQCKCFSLMFL